MDPQNLSMRFGFITFRAHESEPQVFEDFLTIFLPILHKHAFYAYTVEEDNTPGRHLHAFFSLKDTQTDKTKIDQKFNTKLMNEFKNSLKLKQTQWRHAWHVPDTYDQLVKNTYEDVMKTLGYTMKSDVTDWRKSIHGISKPVVTQAVDFYRSTARIKNSCVKNDWKQVNAKNFHCLCEHFADQNDMTVHDYELIAKMTHARHTFNIPDRAMKKCLSELKFANKNYDPESMDFRTINYFQDEVTDPASEEVYKNEIKELKAEARREYLSACDLSIKLKEAQNTITRLKREIKRYQETEVKKQIPKPTQYDID